MFVSLLMVQTWLMGSDSLYADSENVTHVFCDTFSSIFMNSDALVT